MIPNSYSDVRGNLPSPFDWRNLLAFIFSYHRSSFFFAQIIALCSALLSAPIPLLMPTLVDEVLLKKEGAVVHIMNYLSPIQWHSPILYITFITILVLLLRIGSLLLNIWQVRQFTYISKNIIYHIRLKLLTHLQQVSLSEYDTLGSGAVASHFTVDLEAIDQFINTTISKFTVALLTIIGVAFILLWINWWLGLFILFANPLVIYFTITFSKKIKYWKIKENTAYETFQSSLTETLDSIQQIRAANREKYYIQKLINLANDIRNHSTTYTWKNEMANRLSFLIFLCSVEIFRATAMLLVVFSNLSIGQMFAIFSYLWFMMAPVQEIVNMRYAFASATGALTRINKLLALKNDPYYSCTKDIFIGKKTTSISLKNICFSYPTNSSLIFNHANLNIRAGRRIALIGMSGEGKSTLTQILLGLYYPQSGEVFFDGIPITKIGLDIVRNNVTAVLQNPALFNDTVRTNLTLGKDVPDDQLWQALTIAQLRETVMNMDHGLDTLVGRQGTKLSGGQKQRLAIARMVVANPKVVILDEATSALDMETERKLYQALFTFLNGRTTIIITHRLNIIRQVDKVYVVDNGSITEITCFDNLKNSSDLLPSLSVV
ncbi:ABC transporter ATP-binding protein [Candidatus Nitrosacidococcus sp. I8]|uniref:ABC transporter ATP-binding protein n=1 Tax=Candidatus Nitrosacidococcus sp. I8 TaxID=2942908 RepID=UPI002225C05F|nr:ABC transporter ATP-binding protein [Candidatus Nitrosacidococcus sp. I8]CAH9018138.1 Multidrug resistance ABC transporter ATP-binding and permease protein [Candidatus Nitrosacidococcus sp. I8]